MPKAGRTFQIFAKPIGSRCNLSCAYCYYLGENADFVLLSEYPLEVDPMKIKDIKIDMTLMNGRITYMAAEKGLYHH